MADNERNYPQDVDGYEYVTNALKDTLNSYPGLEDGEKFEFSLIPNAEGFSFIASSGSFIVEERESITGHVLQMCAYPFMVIYRASGLNQKRKIAAKEWMDTLGKWLTRQPVKIDGQVCTLDKWPDLTDGREIRTITRQTPAYLGGINEDESENWVMDMMIQYRNEFDR